MTRISRKPPKKVPIRKAPGIPIRIAGDIMPLGRLYISHRQMWLEFPTGVSRRTVQSIFPTAEIVIDREDDKDRILKARIVGFWWIPGS